MKQIDDLINKNITTTSCDIFIVCKIIMQE